MKSRPHTGFGFLLLGIILFLGCRSMYYDPTTDAPAGQGFASTGTVSGSFSAIQVDPRSEDSAGPVFARVGDFDGDGLKDVVSAWNQSQPIQIHLQRRNAAGDIAFETIPLGGTTPIARVAGLEVADMDADGRPDVVVLIKDTGRVAVCDPARTDCDTTQNGGVVDGAIEGGIGIFYNPGQGARVPWTATLLTTSFLAGRNDGETLEVGGYTGIAVGDIDGMNGLDIVVALNSAEGDPALPLTATDGFPQFNSIDLWPNPGAGLARNNDAWSRTMIYADRPAVGAVRILDVDRDGDNDVVCTYPKAASTNVRWLPNPLDLGDLTRVIAPWGLHAPIGQVSAGAEALAIGDIDHDGVDDVVVRSAKGQVVQWFRSPAFPSFDFIRNPWQVYTLAEFLDREPQAIAIGDLTGDGQPEVAISAGGAVAWFGISGGQSVYDQWKETLLIDDSPDATAGSASTGTNGLAGLLQVLTDPQQQGQQQSTVTSVNTLLIDDIDGDGWADIIGTLDRQEGSGLTNDALIMFRNRRTR